MTEKMYQEKPDVAARFMQCFVEATRHFIKDPTAAEKYVRETMFKNQVSSEDYRDAMENATFTEDIDLSQVQLTTDFMARYNIGKMVAAPQAKDWVKLDLLSAAQKAQKN